MSIRNGLASIAVLLLACLARAAEPDPAYKPAAVKAATADEPFLDRFSVEAAAQYLDERAHLVERNCYACHSTFVYLPARSVIDPLAAEVMRTRILLERFTEMVLDPARSSDVKIQHIPRVRVLAAVELARHDALTTGKLSPLTRRALDAMWQFQRGDGGIQWIHVGEAPQAIDDYWPVAMVALGAGTAREDYARTDRAKAGIEKLRGWLRAHPPKTLHERGLTLLSDSAIGSLLGEDQRLQHIEALLAKQHDDGGWSIAELANWKRPDRQPLDSTRSDGYATGFTVLALARSGVPRDDPGLRKGIEWLKANQRRSGGWFTPSPFKRDDLASNTGTSFAIQALAACGEITPPRVTTAQFAAAHAAADLAVPAGVYAPGSTADGTKPY